MEIEITKSDLERAVPAAREPKGKIFDVLEDTIMCKAEEIGSSILGDPGIAAVEDSGNASYASLRSSVKRLACVSAFLDEMRGLDLVLTSTGFGVVSTQSTAPASKMRVDSLDGELRRQERVLRSRLVHQLFRVQGWSNTAQRHANVETLFYYFGMLESYAGISHPKPEDWDQNTPAMAAADNILRKHISHAYMDELLCQVTSCTVTAPNTHVILLCQRYIGAWIAQNRQLQDELFMRLINRMEEDLSHYPTYSSSEAYRLNHFEPYQNHAGDSAFHFVG